MKESPKHTLFCDAVHDWTKNQDVCAAVGASSEAAVAAQTCGAKHRQATDTLMITEQRKILQQWTGNLKHFCSYMQNP